MRIGPLELRRAQAATTSVPDADLPAPHTPEGASGTINIGGWLQPDEYNPELTWPKSLQTYERMMRGDPAVRESMWHIIAPILNADWDVEPGSDEPIDLEIAEFARRAYFKWCQTPFKPTMALTLKYLPQGFQLFELPEMVVTDTLTYADPKTSEPISVPERQFVTWQRWAHRRAQTIWKWDVFQGQLVEVMQWAFKDGDWGLWTIPAESIALFVNEQEGDDFTGISLLRTAYKPWKMKDLVERIMVMAIERHGLGVNVAYVPDDARTDSDLVDKVEDMLQDLVAGKNAYLVFPGPKATAGSSAGSGQGYFFEIVTPPGGIPDFVTGPLTYLRGDIKGNVLARFSELGHGSVGARATGNVQAEVWYDAVHATADYVTSVHNDAIKRLVLKNYSQVENFPTLVARNIETKSLLEFAQANAQLTAAGAINVDRSYRQYVREGIDAPGEDEPAEDEDTGDLTEPLDPSTPIPGIIPVPMPTGKTPVMPPVEQPGMDDGAQTDVGATE